MIVSTPGPRPLREPPDRLPGLAALAWTGPLWRIADAPGIEARVWDAPRYRFDAPHGEYPALYTCTSAEGTFAEVYAERGRRLGMLDGRRHLLRIVPRAPLRVIDFMDLAILSALDLDERISVGDDYTTCQHWALAIHQQCATVDGIRYRARKAGATIGNVMLYLDRCLERLDVERSDRLDTVESLVLRAADRYRLSVHFPFARSQ